jgi:hypothetical protein
MDHALKTLHYRSTSSLSHLIGKHRRHFPNLLAAQERQPDCQQTSQPEKGADTLDKNNPYTAIIAELLDTTKKYLACGADEWELLGQEDDIRVWKVKSPIPKNVENSRWPCITSITTIDLPIDKLCQVVMDSSQVPLYNKYSGGRDDVVTFGNNTKIVWNRTKIPFAIKPYDFCTLMHMEVAKSSTYIVSKAVQCPDVPPHPDYSRSEVIFGLNILTPLKDDNSKTEFMTISHVRYKGIHPFLAWRSALQGSLTYFKSLKEAIRAQHHQ